MDTLLGNSFSHHIFIAVLNLFNLYLCSNASMKIPFLQAKPNLFAYFYKIKRLFCLVIRPAFQSPSLARNGALLMEFVERNYFVCGYE
jgi:hypothetical protein